MRTVAFCIVYAPDVAATNLPTFLIFPICVSMICFGFPSETGLPFLHHYTTQIQFILPPENCTLHKQLYKTYDWNATDKRLNQMFVYIELIFRHMFLFQLIKLGREKKSDSSFVGCSHFVFVFIEFPVFHFSAK